MDLILNGVEFEHQPSISAYNDNFYKHKKNGYVIREICYEDYNYYEFYIQNGRDECFLGSSQNGIPKEGSVTIDFRQVYT